MSHVTVSIERHSPNRALVSKVSEKLTQTRDKKVWCPHVNGKLTLAVLGEFY